jgi:hypothetical protein
MTGQLWIYMCGLMKAKSKRSIKEEGFDENENLSKVK